ncbi:MAG: penicillin-binding protein 1A [Acidimicrobiales bacterium]
MRTIAKLAVLILAGAIGLVVAVLAGMAPAHALLTAGSAGGPSDALVLAKQPQRSEVYAADNSLLTTFHAGVNRQPVEFSDIPAGVVNAVIDTEDTKFWDHHGVNPSAMVRALLTDTSAGGIKQGGSTITQQLVKNTLLTNAQTASRKIKEAVLAVRLENQLSKQQIMERYLNTVYFGNGAYGIKAAAEVYFGVPVRQLTRIQGALLAGLISNPDGLDPFRFPTAAEARRNFVLDRMVASDTLTRAEAEAAKLSPLPVKRAHLTPPPDGQDDYFIEEVKQRLLSEPSLGDTPQARYNAVFRGGLKIYTTLSPALEQAAKQAVANHLPDEHGTWTAALVSVDTHTGAVRALVGGPGFDRSQYRIATQGPGRQPGSSFKPIVLAAALKAGYNIQAGVDGTTPCAFTNPGSAPYIANNTESTESGYFDLTSAMAQSINCAYLRLGIDVGLDKVVAMGKALGIETPLHPYLSLSLGAQEARPIDMAGVYATFANDGVHHRPFVVDRVVDRTGKTIFRGGDKGTQVLSPDKAHELLVALQAVVTQGTGTAAALADRPVAGKTGTSEANGNAWFDGVTPQLSTVVWMGSPIGNVPMTNVCGVTATGGNVCPGIVYGATIPAPIWHDFMAAALADQPPAGFPPPNPGDMGTIFQVPPVPGSYTPGVQNALTPPPTYPPRSYTRPTTAPRKTRTTSPPPTVAASSSTTVAKVGSG